MVGSGFRIGHTASPQLRQNNHCGVLWYASFPWSLPCLLTLSIDNSVNSLSPSSSAVVSSSLCLAPSPTFSLRTICPCLMGDCTGITIGELACLSQYALGQVQGVTWSSDEPALVLQVVWEQPFLRALASRHFSLSGASWAPIASHCPHLH